MVVPGLARTASSWSDYGGVMPCHIHPCILQLRQDFPQISCYGEVQMHIMKHPQ